MAEVTKNIKNLLKKFCEFRPSHYIWHLRYKTTSSLLVVFDLVRQASL